MKPHHCKECLKKFQDIRGIKNHFAKEHSVHKVNSVNNHDVNPTVISELNVEEGFAVKSEQNIQTLIDVITDLRNKLKRCKRIISYQRKQLKEFKEKYPEEEKVDTREERSSYDCTEPGCKRQFAIWQSLTGCSI